MRKCQDLGFLGYRNGTARVLEGGWEWKLST